MFTQHFALIIFQNFMWTEALTWVKCSNPAGNHKSTWGLRPHKVTSMRGEIPETWVSMQTRGGGSENRNLLLIQTFSFSLLKAPVCILNTCLNAGSWSQSPQHLPGFAPFGHSLSLVVAPPQPNHMASDGPPSGASMSGDCSAEFSWQWLGDMTLGLCTGTSLSPWWWKISIPGHTLISCYMCRGPDTTGGFPGGTSGKEPACQCRRHQRHGFDPWVGKISWRRAWQTTLVFLPGESHGQRSLEGYSPQGPTELDMTEVT